MTLHELAAAECARFGVPGAAVAAVLGDEVVLSDGFGRRDATEPVTARTLFMLASDTKCFAAATLCLLVEEGLLDLDQPVRDVLPWFAMHDERVSEWVTTRDLLAHRTGLPKHELVTVGNGDFRITNEQVARGMRHLEASRPFREGFGYNNVHYAAAGHVAEVLTGRSWREVLAERLLGPLGMTASSTYRPALTTGDFAAPHVGGRRIPFQTREYDLPSGGLVTSADDLGRWLLARNGRGPLSSTVLRMLHTPSVISGEDLPFPEAHAMGYALGNVVFSYRGHRMHLHGGGQIGFASQVVVVPEAQAGVAVLTNEHGSRLPLALALALVDRLLGLDPVPWGERLAGAPPAPRVPAPAAEPGREVAALAGTYSHPAYGDLVLDVRDGALLPSFHGLDGELELLHRGSGSWVLRYLTVPGFDFPVTFRTGTGGAVDAVALGIEPELAPIVFPRTG